MRRFVALTALLAALLFARAAPPPPPLARQDDATLFSYFADNPDDFSILAIAAEQAAGLKQLLEASNTSLTVFAPTDAAFFDLATLVDPDASLQPGDKPAVAAALAAALAPLMGEPDTDNATLATVLSYHALQGRRKFSALLAAGAANTLQGEPLAFVPGKVLDRDRSRPDAVAAPVDEEVSNGIIHVVDAVLLHFNLDVALGATPGPEPDDGGGVPISDADDVPDAIVPDPRPTIADLLAGQPETFGVLTLIAQGIPGLLDTLGNSSAVLTVFPPTDSAFLTLARTLSPDSKLNIGNKQAIAGALSAAIAPLANVSESEFATVDTIISYHAIAAAFSFQELESRGSFATLQGRDLTFRSRTVVDLDPSRGNPKPQPRNVLCLNGWVNVVDTVLLPFNLKTVIEAISGSPAPTASPDPEGDGGFTPDDVGDVPNPTIPSPFPTILGYLNSLPGQFSILVRAVGEVKGLPDPLDDPESRLSLFAPNDEAFINLANILDPAASLGPGDTEGAYEVLTGAIGALGDLPSPNSATLGSILAYHLVTKAKSLPDLDAMTEIPTAAGFNLSVDGTTVSDGDDSRADPTAFRPNVFTKNGWVHVIDGVLLPFNLDQALGLLPATSPSPEESPEESAAPGGSSDDDDDGVCFPGTVTVRLQDDTAIAMSSLRAGHAIHVGSGKTSKVFAFTHKLHSRVAMFHELTTASGHSVSMTAGHYLYANGALTAAASVRVGDMLRTSAGDSPVVKVRVVEGTGLFAPHTIHGDIEVNGVVVSGYSRAVHPWVAHALLAPVRAVSKYCGVVEPLGSLLYEGADGLLPYMPKGSLRYRSSFSLR